MIGGTGLAADKSKINLSPFFGKSGPETTIAQSSLTRMALT
jgi:hypothetical protein